MNEFVKRNYKLIVALLFLLLGVLFVLFSEPKDNTENKKEEKTFDENEYEKNLEQRLKKIVEEIDGVGEVSVMLTLEGSAIFSYATDVSQDTKAEGDLRKESTVVLSLDGSSKKDAVVSGYTLPEVKGAAVVCSNTLSPTLQSKVIGVVSAALGIPTSKIFVTN
ncbi:MAG: hypothetical protein E7582_05890 [Ruminococcaceae bacterium]|nr:hypothetical protein [Oscillospiraceae bacterium]